MTYKELKDRQQAEILAFPSIEWAANEKQLADGMRKLGLNPDTDKDKLCSIRAVGIIRITDEAAAWAMLERHRNELQEAIAADKTGERGGFIYDMFYTELVNYDYANTADINSVLNACRLTFDLVHANRALCNGLDKAVRDLIG